MSYISGSPVSFGALTSVALFSIMLFSRFSGGGLPQQVLEGKEPLKKVQLALLQWQDAVAPVHSLQITEGLKVGDRDFER